MVEEKNYCDPVLGAAALGTWALGLALAGWLLYVPW